MVRSFNVHTCHVLSKVWCKLDCTMRLNNAILSVHSELHNEAREIRTPNLVIWSHMRYRCAIAPLEDSVRTSFRMFASKRVAEHRDLASP